MYLHDAREACGVIETRLSELDRELDELLTRLNGEAAVSGDQ